MPQHDQEWEVRMLPVIVIQLTWAFQEDRVDSASSRFFHHQLLHALALERQQRLSIIKYIARSFFFVNQKHI